MSAKFFITGTDTGVGKTHISVGLLKAYQQLGYATLGLKPIASGSEAKGQLLRNQDALALQAASSIQLPYEQVNPFCFQPPIAPHLAAVRAQADLSVAKVMEALAPGLSQPGDVVVVEGAGGWHVPLNATETLADLAAALNLPVVLVVGIRLGCINHAILTLEAIKNKKIPIAGWVANCFEQPPEESTEIIETLKIWLKAPHLGLVNFNQSAEQLFQNLIQSKQF